MVVRMQNSDANKFNMSGVRIHDYTHEDWKQDVDIIVPAAGERVAYLTIPKSTKAVNLGEMIDYIRNVGARSGIKREIPIHALIETHGALHEIWEIAEQPNTRWEQHHCRARRLGRRDEREQRCDARRSRWRRSPDDRRR